jgi:DNA replication protein DnaC
MGYGDRLLRRKRESGTSLVCLSDDDEEGQKLIVKKSNSSPSHGDVPKNEKAPSFIPLDSPSESDEPELSPQQQLILERILKGENYFFTGSAGTGKSVLLRAIIKAFKEKSTSGRTQDNQEFEKRWQEYIKSGGKTEYPKQNLVQRWQLGVTASTGMAGV